MAHMPRFVFSHKSSDGDADMGMVQSPTFAGALAAISDELDAENGDVLELGVAGFPPARFLCVKTGTLREVTWQPAGRLAA